MTADYTKLGDEDYAEWEGWRGDYDGMECPNCKRPRMLLCNNGKRRCEKCNWDPDANGWSDCPPQ